MSNEVKMKELAIIIKGSDGNVYQVLLSEKEKDAIISTISLMHNGQIKVIDQKLEGIDINNKNKKNETA